MAATSDQNRDSTGVHRVWSMHKALVAKYRLARIIACLAINPESWSRDFQVPGRGQARGRVIFHWPVTLL